ncbi:hypothetical protein HMPREF3226_02426 [Prevotella corporis]|uniref:Uncharacterized protein n=1 Tax=Prevotella corporis TaxID=28128 RepID=A0A133PVZ2_9BACT|nr:hypothetical protein HMPREF3226_02426 [Prevotella corporis]
MKAHLSQSRFSDAVRRRRFTPSFALLCRRCQMNPPLSRAMHISSYCFDIFS